MMEPKECAEAWKTVVSIYQETIKGDSAKITMKKIVETLGLGKTREVFATVAAIKKHDGRIYGENRDYMNSIPVHPDAVVCSHDNPVFNCNLDYIHTSHINQLITELRTGSYGD